MPAVQSTMLDLGTPAPNFSLKAADGSTVALTDLDDARCLVVVFMCNHCPFVKHLFDGLAAFERDFVPRGAAIVGINSNDVERYPDDAPEKMAEVARAHGFGFPYLYDESQEVAKACRAACTPEFYVFDGQRRLVYRGQFDDSRPNNDEPVTGADLRAAVESVLAGQPIPEPQRPSLGCSIKWKPGNEPDYAPGN